jgi:putative ABC transport system ATP-binding protein
MNPGQDPVIRTEKVVKIYEEGGLAVEAVREVDLTIRSGEFIALVGPSGSGKTTLLNLVSGLDRPTSGRVFLGDRLLSEMTGNELSDFRRDHIGFIFQSYNLIPVLTVVENVEYVMLLQKRPRQERAQRVREILARVGMAGMEGRFPVQLSGGQQQRVAVARAMASAPDLVLADEPTANLDSRTGSDLIDMMLRLNRDTGMTFLFSTHDRMIEERAKRVVTLKDGRIEQDETR